MIEIDSGILIERLLINGKTFATYERKRKLVLFNLPPTGGLCFVLNKDELETLTMWLIKIQDEMPGLKCKFCGTNGPHYCPNDIAKD